MTLTQMRRASGKMNLQWPRSIATSTINTCFCLPPAAPLLALERIPIVASTFRVNQIPIAEPAAPSAHSTRGFVLWRLSDDGRVASRTISIGRHPKPCTKCEELNVSKSGPLCPNERTSTRRVATSLMGHTRKWRQ
jgi:hypothetical protein